MKPWANVDDSDMPGSLFVDLPRLDWQIVAACDGLPGLPTAGVTGHVDEGKYVYLSAWPSPPSSLDAGGGKRTEGRP